MLKKKRELTEKDLIRMRLPKLYWKCRFDGITNDGVAKQDIRKYFNNINKMHDNGKGLILFGKNGTGKTGILSVVGKEFARWGATVLFIEFADIRGIVIDKVPFDEQYTLWERAKAVDVLLIDDIGKGLTEESDKSGFGARTLDELLRHRVSNKKVTFVTTNMEIEELKQRVMVSTADIFKECFILGIKVVGSNFRDKINKEFQEIFKDI